MSQTQQILQHLKTGQTIDPDMASQKFLCRRLAARIYDIRAMGYLVESKPIGTGFSAMHSYRLVTP